ncbi:N-acetyltransferase family protein [Pantoea sp. Mb-10]|uniref:GNAT family N-acetyltransferase n=1 Tax=unclassified Pantoea TaxID=2630326 RepID=UPI001E4D9A30|nr:MULTISPECIES: GNAT family N-acetyltransferase [unclassified Pantoea]MCE0490290.1 N-acetyltransferase family protein [Pantoea sp. Mb-10]MCE0501421.1 N-acetyltransferase family protein [Pantoea sp. Pb-8]
MKIANPHHVEYNYRKAKPGDLQDLVTIYNYAVGTFESTCDVSEVSIESRRTWLRDHINNPARPLWVAYVVGDPTKICGYLCFSDFLNAREGYKITSDLAIYLHPNYQSQGLGSFLLSSALKVAPTLGIHVLATTIFSSNKKSLSLFKKFDFQVWGELPGVANLNGKIKDLTVVGIHL